MVSPFPSTIAAAHCAQPDQSRLFLPMRTVLHNTIMHLPLYGVVVPIFMQLVSLICQSKFFKATWSFQLKIFSEPTKVLPKAKFL